MGNGHRLTADVCRLSEYPNDASALRESVAWRLSGAVQMDLGKNQEVCPHDQYHLMLAVALNRLQFLSIKNQIGLYVKNSIAI